MNGMFFGLIGLAAGVIASAVMGSESPAVALRRYYNQLKIIDGRREALINQPDSPEKKILMNAYHARSVLIWQKITSLDVNAAKNLSMDIINEMKNNQNGIMNDMIKARMIVYQKNLSILRELVGWRAYELADKCMITKQTISKIETGKSEISFAQLMMFRSIFYGILEGLKTIGDSNVPLEKALYILDNFDLYTVEDFDKYMGILKKIGEVVVNKGDKEVVNIMAMALPKLDKTGA